MRAADPNPNITVVGHPNVVKHNQVIYVRLAELGWNVTILVPARWRDDYRPGGYTPEAVDGFVGRFIRLRVMRPGVIQRHIYATRTWRWIDETRPDVLFLENEPYGVPTAQWLVACETKGVPWGVQGDDNLDRPLPLPAKVIRACTMPRIDYFAARSPGALKILNAWGAKGPVGIVPHTIPEWNLPSRPRRPDARFTIGFAGRLVEQKGVRDLVDAVKLLDYPTRLLVVGGGPLAEWLRSADAGLAEIELRTGIDADQMPAHYAEMDVLVLPSRTTTTWAEQFGKSLCEALLCGTPVIGSISGEIPWVIETSGGGLTFPEGDAAALAHQITRLHDDTELRTDLALVGRKGVLQHFAPRVAAKALDTLIRTAVPELCREPDAP